MREPYACDRNSPDIEVAPYSQLSSDHLRNIAAGFTGLGNPVTPEHLAGKDADFRRRYASILLQEREG